MPVKKYASHRLYDSSRHYYRQSVVAVDEEGRVSGYAPLADEASFTEWIGGVIVLSDKPVVEPEIDFKALLHQLEGTPDTAVYAYHISAFDFEKEALTAQSVIRRL